MSGHATTDEGAEPGHGRLVLPGLWELQLAWKEGALVAVSQAGEPEGVRVRGDRVLPGQLELL